MSLPKVEVFPDAQGGFRFRVKGGNGEIMAQSESYTRREDAERGVDALAAALVVAPTVHV